MMNKIIRISLLSLMLFILSLSNVHADQKTQRIATIDLKIIMTQSMVGQASQKIMEAKLSELKEILQPEQDKLVALEKEIKTKSSVWPEEVRIEKENEFMALRQEFNMASQYEVKKLEKAIVEPVLKDINEIVEDIAKEKNYDIVLNNSTPGFLYGNVLLYANRETTDISELVWRELDARAAREMEEMKKKAEAGETGPESTPVEPSRE